MANGQHFGVTEANTLGTGAQGHGDQAGLLNGQVQALIGEMEADVNAMAGNQLGAFQKAKVEFINSYNALASKMGLQGIDMGDIHTMGGNTDVQVEGDYNVVGSSIPQISAKL